MITHHFEVVEVRPGVRQLFWVCVGDEFSKQYQEATDAHLKREERAFADFKEKFPDAVLYPADRQANPVREVTPDTLYFVEGPKGGGEKAPELEAPPVDGVGLDAPPVGLSPAEKEVEIGSNAEPPKE